MKIFHKHFLLLVLIFFTFSGTTFANPAAVAAADPYSVKAAEETFKKGGNAVDAAVAIAFTLAVTLPDAGNIGGGGFMTLYIDHKPYFLDYRERAPIKATKNMYLDSQGNVIKGMSLYGIRAVGVPGTVAGLWTAHQRFGKLPWAEVLAPAIRYAEEGFTVSKHLADLREYADKNFVGKTNFDKYFSNLKTGNLFKQPELSVVLKRIAKYGAKDFYTGKTSDLLIAEMQKNNGLITKQDLKNYKPVWRNPIIAKWKDYEIITAPPPSSGGIGLVQLLKMKNDLRDHFQNVPVNSVKYVHYISEIEKRVFADRAEYLGDPDFYKVPVTELIDNNYLKKREGEIDYEKPSVTENVKPGLPQLPQTGKTEKLETTHFSVLDKWGNAVSNTYTLNGPFGSGVVVSGAGFLLNDEMDDFSVKPGIPNLFGVVGSDANAISATKRPLSSMTPTIITKNGKVTLVIGTPGGSRIFTSIFQVINNIYDYHMSLPDAVSEMRFHHQLLPSNTIFMEKYKPLKGQIANQLKSMGYVLETQDFNGDIQVIKIDGKKVETVSDPRGTGVGRVIH